MVTATKCPACGLMQLPGPACKSCGAAFGRPAGAPRPPQPLRMEPPVGQSRKIGGWLILLGIGLVLTPLRGAVFVLKDILPAFSHDTWAVLTTPGTGAYHALWAPLLIFELAGNTAFILFSAVAAVCFFQRRRLAPKILIAFYLSNLLFVAVDYFAGDWIPAVAAQQDLQATVELGRILLTSLIWVPYLLRAKRVKATFVR